MKRTVFVDGINNAWARLVFDESEEQEMNVHLGTLYQFIKDEIRPEDFLEITIAEDQKTITAVRRKLVEETKKQKGEAIAQHNRLVYGTSKPESKKLFREVVGDESYEYYPLGEYIVAAPGVCGGRPTFKYTRIDVRHALSLLVAGHTVEQVAKGYEVPIEAVKEALRLASQALDQCAKKITKTKHDYS
jgi:uncharacterized protein (DUF433 family)